MKEIEFKKYSNGFTLIEVLVAVCILSIISFAVYLAYANILEAIIVNQWRFKAVSIIENEIETVRNMPYEDIGILDGYPTGKLLAEKIVPFGGINFLLKTFVRNVDDPFDGTTGGIPNDTAPADYKLIQFETLCLNCREQVSSIIMTTRVAPKNLETTTNNGSLFINVFNANGDPVQNANVRVINNALNPAITINDTTNNDGVLQLVDIPTSTASYEIKVSKFGYSSEQTYLLGAPQNPNPKKPHATVAKQQVTFVSFAIDKTSSLDLTTKNLMCSNLASIDFNIAGQKLIGTNPDVLKYSNNYITDSSGLKLINSLEWDTYSLLNINSTYDLSGVWPFSPLIINPNSNYSVNWILEPKNPSALLVSVVGEDGNQISGVNVNLNKAGFNEFEITGRRSVSETDWSGLNYFEQSGGIDVENPAGEIHLIQSGGTYLINTIEWIVSKTIDFGTSNLSLYNLEWNPALQSSETGFNSISFQIATNNDGATWNFIGPDGTENSFYTTSGTQLSSIHNNNRYLRYKIFMKTDNENFTPIIDNIKISFSSSCFPAGQSFFNGLANDIYIITASKNGYQTFTDNALSITNDWQDYKIILLPQ